MLYCFLIVALCEECRLRQLMYDFKQKLNILSHSLVLFFLAGTCGHHNTGHPWQSFQSPSIHCHCQGNTPPLPKLVDEQSLLEFYGELLTFIFVVCYVFLLYFLEHGCFKRILNRRMVYAHIKQNFNQLSTCSSVNIFF